MDYTSKIAIFDPCTHFEHAEGKLQELLENYLIKTPSSKYKFDWFFMFNRGGEENYKDLLIYEGHPNINKIYLINEKIPKKEDVYIRQHSLRFSNELEKIEYTQVKMPEFLPALGGASGPNLGFYLAIEILFSRYNHDYFFMVEHDSRPCQDYWFDHMFNYVDEKDFLIAGSKYKGHQKWHYVLNYKDHLNGIGIYKNDKRLLDFVKSCKDYNSTVINESDWCINFDILLYKFLQTHKGKSIINHKKPFINTDFITNVSDPNDYYLSEKNILDNHPNTIIIHQKKYQNLQKFRRKYVEDEFKGLFSSKNYPESCMFLLRQPRGAGNWLINSITASIALTSNYIQDAYPVPYFLKIKVPIPKTKKHTVCDFFFMSNRLIESFKRGFKSATAELTPAQFRTVYAEIKEFIRPILICNDPFTHGNNFRTLLSLFIKENFFGYNLDFYAVLRKSFDKTKSLYTEKLNPTTSSKESFIKFLNSNQLPDSFLIRTLTNVIKPSEIEFFHYEEAVRILEEFSLFDISQTDELLMTSFKKTFGIDQPISFFQKNNKYSLKSQHLVSLSEKDLEGYIYKKNQNINLGEYFKGRVFFDDLLYETFIPKDPKIELFYKNRSVKSNLFDFELSSRQLTILTFISESFVRKDLVNSWRSSWESQGFNALIKKESSVLNSLLLPELKLFAQYLSSNLITYKVGSEEKVLNLSDSSFENFEIESFYPLIAAAELNSSEPFYFSQPFIYNKTFQAWEPDSIFHFMDSHYANFFSCNSDQAVSLLRFLFDNKQKIKSLVNQDLNFNFTLSNVLYLLFDDIKQLGWVRSTNLSSIDSNFIEYKDFENTNLEIQNDIQTI